MLGRFHPRRKSPEVAVSPRFLEMPPIYRMGSILTFVEWVAVNEAARRSFTRTLGKYGPEVVDKPVATMTAWRGELLDLSGRPHPEATRRKLNDEANRKFGGESQETGPVDFPVVGAGQEADKLGDITVNKENSFIVQPVGGWTSRSSSIRSGNSCSTRPASEVRGRSLIRNGEPS